MKSKKQFIQDNCINTIVNEMTDIAIDLISKSRIRENRWNPDSLLREDVKYNIEKFLYTESNYPKYKIDKKDINSILNNLSDFKNESFTLDNKKYNCFSKETTMGKVFLKEDYNGNYSLTFEENFYKEKQDSEFAKDIVSINENSLSLLRKFEENFKDILNEDTCINIMESSCFDEIDIIENKIKDFCTINEGYSFNKYNDILSNKLLEQYRNLNENKLSDNRISMSYILVEGQEVPMIIMEKLNEDCDIEDKSCYIYLTRTNKDKTSIGELIDFNLL